MKQDAGWGWAVLFGVLLGVVITSVGFYVLRYEPPVFEITADLDLVSTYPLPDKPPFAAAVLRKGAFVRMNFQKGAVAYLRIDTAIDRSVLDKHARLVKDSSGHPLFGTVNWW
jgi:hypothetical protein